LKARPLKHGFSKDHPVGKLHAGHILNAINDSLFDLYNNVKFAKELWKKLETRYMKQDTITKGFIKGFKRLVFKRFCYIFYTNNSRKRCQKTLYDYFH